MDMADAKKPHVDVMLHTLTLGVGLSELEGVEPV